MSFNSDLVQALRERQFDNVDPNGAQLTANWNKKNYPVCAGDAKTMKSLGIGGYGADANCILVIALSDIVPGYQTSADLVNKIPAAKQTILYEGLTYRIQDTTIPPGLAFIVLVLIDPTRGV